MESKLNDFVQAQLQDDSNLAGDQRAALFHFTQVQYGERLTLAENQQKALQAFWMNEKKEFLPIAKHLERIFNTPYFVDKVTAKQAQRSNQQLIFYLKQQIIIGTVVEGSNESITKHAKEVTYNLFLLENEMENDVPHPTADQASIRVAAEGMAAASKLMKILETECASRMHDIYLSSLELDRIYGQPPPHPEADHPFE